MSTYFIITGKTERDEWEAFRSKWVLHRDASLEFMNRLGGAEIRVNHLGEPIAMRFDKGVERPEGFRKTEWGTSGAHLFNVAGTKLYADDIQRIKDLNPAPFIPQHVKHLSHAFECDPHWTDVTRPIYLLARYERAVSFLNEHGGYRQISDAEFKFRQSWDEFVTDEFTREGEVFRCDDVRVGLLT